MMMSEQTTIHVPTTPPPAVLAKPTPKRRKPAAKSVDLSAVEIEFEAFWLAFPNRPNNPKVSARRSWLAVRKEATAEQIMAGLARYAFSPDPKFRPMASTWLNQRRYALEPENLDADPYGMGEFLDTLPHEGGLSAHAYEREELHAVLIAAGFAPSWRGDLSPLNGWLADGYQPDSIAWVIAAAVVEFGTRASLQAFDKRVRYRASKINGLT
jgi:hypothetical protein